MPTERAAPAQRKNAGLFFALGDDTRLHLLSRLSREGPLSISRLSAGSRMTRQAVTKHLRVMERSKLLHSAKRGRETIWTLDPQCLIEAQQFLQAISHQWDAALNRLRAFVEDQ